MTTDEEVKFIKVQTCTLRVGIHCQACKDQIKTILRKIDGVYETSINAEQQTVKVSGIFDSEVLIKKLLDQGRHAELCSTCCLSSDLSEQPNFNNDDNNIKKQNNKKTKKKCHNNNQQNTSNPIPQEQDNEQEAENAEEEEHDEEIQQGDQEVVTVNGKKRIHSKGKERVDQKMKGPIMEGSGSGMNNDEVNKEENGMNLMESTSFLVGNPIANVNGAGSSRGWQHQQQQQQHTIPATMVHMNANPQTQFMYQMDPGMIASNTGGYYCTSIPYSDTDIGYYGGAAHYYYYYHYDNVLMNVSTNQDNASGTGCSIM